MAVYITAFAFAGVLKGAERHPPVSAIRSPFCVEWHEILDRSQRHRIRLLRARMRPPSQSMTSRPRATSPTVPARQRNVARHGRCRSHGPPNRQAVMRRNAKSLRRSAGTYRINVRTPPRRGAGPLVFSTSGHYAPRTMPTSKHYRHSAEECRRLAREAHDEFEREALLRMVAQWERLADHKAKREAHQDGKNSN